MPSFALDAKESNGCGSEHEHTRVAARAAAQVSTFGLRRGASRDGRDNAGRDWTVGEHATRHPSDVGSRSRSSNGSNGTAHDRRKANSHSLGQGHILGDARNYTSHLSSCGGIDGGHRDCSKGRTGSRGDFLEPRSRGFSRRASGVRVDGGILVLRGDDRNRGSDSNGHGGSAAELIVVQSTNRRVTRVRSDGGKYSGNHLGVGDRGGRGRDEGSREERRRSQ